MPFETTLSVERQARMGHDNEPQPRPEYARPQLWRPERMNLNGFWDFAFDDLDVGLHDELYTGRSGFDRRIRVPFTFEADQAVSGIAAFTSGSGTAVSCRFPRPGANSSASCCTSALFTGQRCGLTGRW